MNLDYLKAFDDYDSEYNNPNYRHLASEKLEFIDLMVKNLGDQSKIVGIKETSRISRETGLSIAHPPGISVSSFLLLFKERFAIIRFEKTRPFFGKPVTRVGGQTIFDFSIVSHISVLNKKIDGLLGSSEFLIVYIHLKSSDSYDFAFDTRVSENAKTKIESFVEKLKSTFSSIEDTGRVHQAELDFMKHLQKLAEMKEKQLLTDEEYQLAKRKLLGDV
jgi:hypothetical protein